MNKKAVLAGFFLLGTAVQSAYALESGIEVNFVAQDLELDTSSFPTLNADGSGIGGQFTYVFGEKKIGHMFAAIQSVDLDAEPPFAGELETTQFRIGGGAGYQVSEVFYLYGRAEFSNLEFGTNGGDIEDDGIIVSGGAHLTLGDHFRLEGRIGAVIFDNLEGADGELSAHVKFNNVIGIFGAVRAATLEDDFGDEANFTDLRAGVKFYLP